MLHRTKKLSIFVISAFLATSSGYVVGKGIPTVDVESEEKSFCIYKGELYSVGSLVNMNGVSKECTDKVFTKEKRPFWVNEDKVIM